MLIQRLFQFANTRLHPANQRALLVRGDVCDREVLDPDVFVLFKRAADVLLHDYTVFRASRPAWTGVQPYVALFVDGASAAPQMVFRTARCWVVATLSEFYAGSYQSVLNRFVVDPVLRRDLAPSHSGFVERDPFGRWNVRALWASRSEFVSQYDAMPTQPCIYDRWVSRPNSLRYLHGRKSRSVQLQQPLYRHEFSHSVDIMSCNYMAWKAV